jgi:hypothetical protein
VQSSVQLSVRGVRFSVRREGLKCSLVCGTSLCVVRVVVLRVLFVRLGVCFGVWFAFSAMFGCVYVVCAVSVR